MEFNVYHRSDRHRWSLNISGRNKRVFESDVIDPVDKLEVNKSDGSSLTELVPRVVSTISPTPAKSPIAEFNRTTVILSVMNPAETPKI